MKTKSDVHYNIGQWGSGPAVVIPAGTEVIPATNLPDDCPIKYWAQPWPGMSEEAASHERTYGFGLTTDEVTQ